MRKPSLDQSPRKAGSIRCAIYTRKSTDEGLDQEFNSLDAQREACAAYVASQRHEGWALLPDFYDDGGFSGGNMERPGLKRLLAEVRAGKVDVIVVYKVDRLTRALSDFARIVETLDEAGASFVSITQAFNTTTSMGRLTLNVLLSFAQFEREVISERVRDKIAASKRKGMWMGGPVPLGYDVVERKLIPNVEEAEIVCHIMRRYLEVGSVRLLMDLLKREGVLSKVQTLRDGTKRGGVPFVRGPLYCLLKNPIYVGQIPHKKASYPGQHERIVPRQLWDQVQALLAKNGADRTFGTNASDPSLLAGLIQDEQGRGLTPSHANKGQRRYRYYVSTSGSNAPGAGLKAIRLPAGEVEELVTRGVATFLADRSALAMALAPLDLPLTVSNELIHRWSAAGLPFQDKPVAERRAVLIQLSLRLIVEKEQVTATFSPAGLLPLEAQESVDPQKQTRAEIPMPGILVRRGQELRLVYAEDDSHQATRRDRALIGLIVKGFAARQELMDMQDEGSCGTAQVNRSHLARQARASYLAPDIIQAILAGSQPVKLTARQIMKAARMPLGWEEQRRGLGFS